MRELVMTTPPTIGKRNPVSPYDLDFQGFNPRTGQWEVREQLYPESRGWITHAYATEAEARLFAETGRFV